MNVQMKFLAAVLAIVFVAAGGLASGSIVVGPVPSPYIDPVIADEWDEDAPNWAQPGDNDNVPDSDRPLGYTNYLFFGYLYSEDDWDDDAHNWAQPGDIVTVPALAIAKTGYYVYGYVDDSGRAESKIGLEVFGYLHNEDDWDDDASNWAQPD